MTSVNRWESAITLVYASVKESAVGPARADHGLTAIYAGANRRDPARISTQTR